MISGFQIPADWYLQAITLRDLLGECLKLLRREGQERLPGQQMKAVTLLASPYLGGGVVPAVLSPISYDCQF